MTYLNSLFVYCLAMAAVLGAAQHVFADVPLLAALGSSLSVQLLCFFLAYAVSRFGLKTEQWPVLAKIERVLLVARQDWEWWNWASGLEARYGAQASEEAPKPLLGRIDYYLQDKVTEWKTQLTCYFVGHSLEADSVVTPDSGCEEIRCTRCGWNMSHTYY